MKLMVFASMVGVLTVVELYGGKCSSFITQKVSEEGTRHTVRIFLDYLLQTRWGRYVKIILIAVVGVGVVTNLWRFITEPPVEPSAPPLPVAVQPSAVVPSLEANSTSQLSDKLNAAVNSVWGGAPEIWYATKLVQRSSNPIVPACGQLPSVRVFDIPGESNGRILALGPDEFQRVYLKTRANCTVNAVWGEDCKVVIQVIDPICRIVNVWLTDPKMNVEIDNHDDIKGIGKPYAARSDYDTLWSSIRTRAGHWHTIVPLSDKEWRCMQGLLSAAIESNGFVIRNFFRIEREP